MELKEPSDFEKQYSFQEDDDYTTPRAIG